MLYNSEEKLFSNFGTRPVMLAIDYIGHDTWVGLYFTNQEIARG